jgi:hypothetical protein
MNIEKEMRARVLRLLENDYRCEDLARLLMYTRDPPEDLRRPLVTEIGNSIAHPRGRERGLLTTAAKDFFATTTFIVYAGENGGINFESLPEFFIPHMEAMARCVGPKYLESTTGLKSQGAAVQTAKSILTRLKKNEDDSYALPRDLTPIEKDLIASFCASSITPRPLDSNMFFKDFTDILVGAELLQGDERVPFETNIRIPVILFAIAAMHHHAINMHGSKRGVLMAAADKFNNLTTLFSTSINLADGGPATFGSRFYVTDLAVDDCCDGNFPLDRTWNFPIELSDRSTRLVRLGS